MTTIVEREWSIGSAPARAVRVKGQRLILRPADARDRAFIASRWVRSYSAAKASVSRELYEARWNALVDRLLEHSSVYVACSEAEPSALWGFVVADGDVLHYVYVAREFWRAGLARELLRLALGSYPERVKCSHRWPFRGQRFQTDSFYLTGVTDGPAAAE